MGNEPSLLKKFWRNSKYLAIMPRWLYIALFKVVTFVSPAKAFYVIVPPEYQIYGCIPAEQLIPILMKHLNTDYYVALLSAGLFHGATHQKPARFQVMLNKRMSGNLIFADVEIEFMGLFGNWRIGKF